ncbi:HEPN domain-containing protein [Robiginitalea sp. M366]|uniref:HEPN domain-containing protein n=1 Tax=Robiginitalea aestuariiviva TaxID=3036903 RepID=UPI00240DF885|nr:HEPN domain-containing protein [Robiginitalea aestuariiviva]MDG1570916.1 HEPN domain-containing protein [Robiginitalea aestuariiviva]
MNSFRTEIENPVVERDILELERKIRLFREGQLDPEKFRSLRLARGVYGQRQPGVQMIRIKIPYGKLRATQLERIAQVSDEYSTGKLHITTRQDLQIHYVDLDRTPELWAELERDQVTLREACGNTVRNVTASETAGIDPQEAFDVSPYAQAVFEYFLRNPVGQELGRKFKVSFSGSDADTGLSYMHDLGFLARIQGRQRGFKVLIGGGLGAQPRHADVLYEFLEADRIIPLMEAVLRVFDRHGERKSRAKARMKFLLKEMGLEAFRERIREEWPALPYPVYPIDTETYPKPVPAVQAPEIPTVENPSAYQAWKQNNVLPQRQPGYVAVGLKVKLGNFSTEQARALAALASRYAAGELRLTLRQNILLPYVKERWLPYFYERLKALGLAEPGYQSAADITACPGTDTCNLGIASSTGIAAELERLLKAEYPHFQSNPDVVIKISGCMNACGQHTMAHIGFQGMSIRTPDKRVAPALQVLLGGGNLGGGQGLFADKVIKVPSRRGPDALRRILDDYQAHGQGQAYHTYYQARGQQYFYALLKSLADTATLTDEDFIDWGAREKYEKAIGVGECAGVVIDLVATLLLEGREKLEEARQALAGEKWAAALYHAYSAQIHTAKALLTGEGVTTNTHAGILEDFDLHFTGQDKPFGVQPFRDSVLAIQQHAPEADFASRYLKQAAAFLDLAETFRQNNLRYAG